MTARPARRPLGDEPIEYPCLGIPADTAVACSVCTGPITDPEPEQTQHELCRLAQLPWEPQTPG